MFVGWLKVYKAIVLTSLLYGCETWTLHRRHLKMLERFHMRSLRSILAVRWQDRVTNLQILEKSESQSIEAIIPAQTDWSRHPNGRFQAPKAAVCKDCVKDNITQAGIPPKESEQCLQDRTDWRALTGQALVSFEEQRRAGLITARERRKAAAAAAAMPSLWTAVPLTNWNPLTVKVFSSDSTDYLLD